MGHDLTQLVFCYLAVLLLGSAAVESKIDLTALLSSLTIEEKCGQMTQIGIFAVGNDVFEGPGRPLNITKLRNALIDNKIGSIAGPFAVAKAKQWQEVISLMHDIVLNESSSKIPILYGIDSTHGVSFLQDSVLYPQPISLAASFNIDNARKYGEIVAREQRALGINWNFSPIMDIGRQPLWPRLGETMGEDVHLASEMASAYISGHQGSDLKNATKAATCLKHFVGYSVPLNGQDKSTNFIPENILREYHLPSFEAGINAGALTVMVNSGNVNGMPGHANYRYLTEILKGEMKFKGFTVSNWNDVKRLEFRDKLAETPEEAVRIAVMAGVDMSMVPDDFSFTEHCVNLANKDAKFLERVNDAVSRILYVKDTVGLFDNPYPSPSDLKNIGLDEDQEFNLEATRETIILAQNTNNFLPISKNLRILVTGPAGNLLRAMDNDILFSWPTYEDGEKPEGSNKYKLTLYEAINATKEGKDVEYVGGADFFSLTDLESALEAAEKSDVIVLAIGEELFSEFLGNIDDLTLPKHQYELADALFATGKPVIVVYLGGRPRVITKIAQKADAVILGLLPGPRGSEAISEIIFGDTNPSGRLPITFPLSPNGFMTYDYTPNDIFFNGPSNLYPFGHGLSYTTFEYGEIKLNTTTVTPPSGVSFQISVTNTGARAGKEAVLVYLNDEFASISRPVRQLKAFKKISLEAGETKVVDFELSTRDMSFINYSNARVYEPGKFNIYVGDREASFKLVA